MIGGQSVTDVCLSHVHSWYIGACRVGGLLDLVERVGLGEPGYSVTQPLMVLLIRLRGYC